MMNSKELATGVQNALRAFLSVTCSEALSNAWEYNNVHWAIARHIVVLLSLINDQDDVRRVRSVAEFEKRNKHTLFHLLVDTPLENWEINDDWGHFESGGDGSDLDSDDNNEENDDEDDSSEYTDEEYDAIFKSYLASWTCSYIADPYMQTCVEYIPEPRFESDDFDYVGLKELFEKYEQLMEIMPKSQRIFTLVMYPVIMSAMQMTTATFCHDYNYMRRLFWQGFYADIVKDITTITNDLPVLIGKSLYEMFQSTASIVQCDMMPGHPVFISVDD